MMRLQTFSALFSCSHKSLQSKINETKDLMKKKAQEIEKTKIEAAKGGERNAALAELCTGIA